MLSADNMTLQDFLRTLRRERRLTMEQAAKATGIHRSTLHRWENGQAQPRLTELKALLKVLEATPQQRRRALALMEAPRALALTRTAQSALPSRVGPQPHGGDLLRAMRLRCGMSLEEVSLSMAISSATLRRWERMETWPDTEQLQRLCFTLNAALDELHALTCGQFARYARNPEVNAKELTERLDRFGSNRINPPFALKDLEMLTLQADAWKLAARSTAGACLLSRVYAQSAYYLSYRDRDKETIAAVERYFQLIPVNPPGDDRKMAINLRLTALVAMWERFHNPGRITNQQALKEFQRLLPHTEGTMHESYALSLISESLLRQDAQDEAFQMSEEAYQAAQRNIGDEHARWVHGIKGTHLIRAGHYEEGLCLLSTGRPGDWYRLVETWLWKAEAFLGMGERSEAERTLAKAQSDLSLYEMTPLQPRLNALQARVHG
ncbi:MAG: helix-turn-helix transcriptional regulator [Armatimonas sp.]